MSLDLTRGPIGRSLLRFALPLLLSNVVQQLYNAVDLMFAGRCLGKNASAAIGASGLLATCIVGLFGGLSIGAGVVTARIRGAGDRARLDGAVNAAVLLSLAGGAAMTAFGYAFAGIYLSLLRVPQELRRDAGEYLRIYVLSLTAILCYNMAAGLLRAMGDSRRPLCAQIAAGTLNIALDSLFLFVIPMGVAGIAWATLISQACAAGYALLCVHRQVPLRLRGLRPDTLALREVFRIGLPSGVQSLLITLSNVMAQYQINSLGIDSIAAFTNYFKVELVLYMPIVAMGQAVMTFSAQNWGAGDLERVRRGTRLCVIAGAAFILALSAVSLALGKRLFGFFTDDAEVVSRGLRIIAVTFPFYFLYVGLQIWGDSLRGLGRSREPMLIVMLNLCLVRTALLFVLVPRYGTLESAAATYPVTWLLTAACMGICYRAAQRRMGALA